MIARCMEYIDDKFKNEQLFANQHNLQKGLKKFGKEGEEAALKEIKQLHDIRCFALISVADLIKNERKKVQMALTYLTQKRDGTMKGRTAYNGKPTREWLSKQDSASLQLLMFMKGEML